MKKIILVSLILLLFCGNAIADDNYIINGDTVYIDDSNVYLSATPHTLSSSGWVYFNLTSKVYTGNIDACWGFNTSASKPKKAEVYSPYWVNTTTDHQKTFYNPSFITYTGDDLDCGNSYNTNYRYTITESIINDNGTVYITSNAAFDSYTTDGTNYTVYWYTRHDNYYLWKDFSSSFNSIVFDYEGYDKWYYIKNVPIISNKEYTVRTWIDVPVSTEKQFGKYYFAIKPSGETISQAVNNGHFYNLDPWWDATWSNRKNIILTGNISGAQTDYQLLLNVTYEPEMQSDFDDLRFCNETHEIDAWLESKVDSSYALVWVEFPTTPANGVNQTYYMYYGNAGAASDWDGAATFLLFDDFESTLSGWTAHAERGATAYEGSYGMHSSTNNNKHPAHTVTENNICIEAKVKQSGRSGIMVRTTQSPEPSSATGVGYQLFNKLDGNIYIYEQAPANYIATEAAVDPTNDWYNWKFAIDGGDMKGKYWADGASEPAWMVEVNDTTVTSGGIGILGYSTGTYYDLIRVSKYAANPPTYAFIPDNTYYRTIEIIKDFPSTISNILTSFLSYLPLFVGILISGFLILVCVGVFSKFKRW